MWIRLKKLYRCPRNLTWNKIIFKTYLWHMGDDYTPLRVHIPKRGISHLRRGKFHIGIRPGAAVVYLSPLDGFTWRGWEGGLERDFLNSMSSLQHLNDLMMNDSNDSKQWLMFDQYMYIYTIFWYICIKSSEVHHHFSSVFDEWVTQTPASHGGTVWNNVIFFRILTNQLGIRIGVPR